jgi:hypothetical protein
VRITKTTTNKIKTTTNDCGGIMGKSKQVDIFAMLFSLAEKTKPWTGVVGAFVEHQHLFM